MASMDSSRSRRRESRTPTHGAAQPKQVGAQSAATTGGTDAATSSSALESGGGGDGSKWSPSHQRSHSPCTTLLCVVAVVSLVIVTGLLVPALFVYSTRGTTHAQLHVQRSVHAGPGTPGHIHDHTTHSGSGGDAHHQQPSQGPASFTSRLGLPSWTLSAAEARRARELALAESLRHTCVVTTGVGGDSGLQHECLKQMAPTLVQNKERLAARHGSPFITYAGAGQAPVVRDHEHDTVVWSEARSPTGTRLARSATSLEENTGIVAGLQAAFDSQYDCDRVVLLAPTVVARAFGSSSVSTDQQLRGSVDSQAPIVHTAALAASADPAVAAALEAADSLLQGEFGSDGDIGGDSDGGVDMLALTVPAQGDTARREVVAVVARASMDLRFAVHSALQQHRATMPEMDAAVDGQMQAASQGEAVVFDSLHSAQQSGDTLRIVAAPFAPQLLPFPGLDAEAFASCGLQQARNYLARAVQHFPDARANLDVGFFIQVYNNPKAVVEVLKSVRKLMPKAPIYMVCDGGGDFGPLCERIGSCTYKHEARLGDGRTTRFSGVNGERQVSRWMKRLRDGVAALGTEWMVMLEADTLLENYFSVVPPADISGGSTEANVYSREVLQLMRQLSGVVPPCSYSSSGGTAIRSAPFAAMVDQFDTLLLPHLHARDDRVVRESDCTLTAMAVSSGLSVDSWLDLVNPHNPPPLLYRMQTAEMLQEAPRLCHPVQVVERSSDAALFHTQYNKKWYGKPLSREETRKYFGRDHLFDMPGDVFSHSKEEGARPAKQ